MIVRLESISIDIYNLQEAVKRQPLFLSFIIELNRVIEFPSHQLDVMPQLIYLQ